MFNSNFFGFSIVTNLLGDCIDIIPEQYFQVVYNICTINNKQGSIDWLYKK